MNHMLGKTTTKENEMSKQTMMMQYDNPNNGGRERVYRDGDSYYINSDWGTGWCGKRRVSRQQIASTMRHTGAPEDVVAAIMGG